MTVSTQTNPAVQVAQQVNEISFSNVLNLFILRGNPFQTVEENQPWLKQIRKHLEARKNLNLYFRTTEIDNGSRLFLIRLGKLIAKFKNQSAITINWAVGEHEEVIEKGMDLMNLTDEPVVRIHI